MSRQIEMGVRRLVLRLVCEEAGFDYGERNYAWVRVESGASEPRILQETTRRGRRQTTVVVGERWLVDRVEELVAHILEGLGCRLPSICPSGGSLSAKEALLDTALRDHLQLFCARNGVRIENALRAEDIQTYRQLMSHSRAQLLGLPGMGIKLLTELEEALAVLGLRLDDGGEAS